MATYCELDQASLAVIHSTQFRNDAISFLRKEKRSGDTSIRISTDDQLKILARRFCHRHLDKIFPDIRSSGIPDHHSVYREVFKIYRGVKTDLLDQVRLKRTLPPVCVSEPIMPSALHRSVSPSLATTHMSPTPTTSSTSTKRRRRRPRPRKQRAGDGRTSISIDALSGPSTEREPSENQCSEVTQSDSLNTSLAPQEADPGNEHELSEISSKHTMAVDDTICHDSQNALVEELVEQNQRLQITNQHVEYENQILTDYRNFVHYTLRICQDTLLAERNSYKRAKIVQTARECGKVVEVLRDLLSDIDFKYFHDYHRLHKRAPPPRWWLGNVGSQKQTLDESKL